ncbi:MAG: hypothetical protein HOE90_10205 [Bacteriovoracaceae bacterium]|jgi:hypothetical protein|nr:hypothetical protein [Bacteriovoracaceae bacterium]
MSSSAFFNKVKQESVNFGEYEAKTPLFLRDFNLMGGLFTASLSELKKLLPKNLKPIRILPGKGLVAIHCIEYKSSDIGPYNEVAFSIVVQPPGNLLTRPVKFLKEALNKSVHGFVQNLPVSTDISAQGGVEFFHFPKFVADISFRETKHHRICTLLDHETKDLILEMDFKKYETKFVRQDKKHRPISILTFSEEESYVPSAKFMVNPLEWGFSFLVPKMSLRWGSHPTTEKFKALKIGIEFQSIYAPKCEAILYPSLNQ